MQTKKNLIKNYIIIHLWLGIFSMLVYFELLLGATDAISINKYLIHNVLICFLINVLIFYLYKKRRTLLVISVIALIWSTVSHFVLQLHGSALSFSLFKNFKTAVTVIDHYNISIDSRVFFILLLFIVILAVVFLFPKKYIDEYSSSKIHFLFKALYMAAFIFYAVFFSLSAFLVFFPIIKLRIYDIIPNI